jgi:hypothetical protein
MVREHAHCPVCDEAKLPKRTIADVPKEDLIPVRAKNGLVVAVSGKTGEVFRDKRSDKDNRY